MPGEIAAAGITAGAALINGIGSSLLGAHYGHKQHRYNLETMQRQQDYNLANMALQNQYWRSQTDYANALNLSNMQYQQDLSRAMYDYQFGKQAAYNDPAAQRARLVAAGYNPFQGIDTNSMSGNPSAVAPSYGSFGPSVPSSQAISAPVTDLSSILNATTNSLSSIVDNVSKLFLTAKSDAERKNIIHQTKKVISETVAQDIANQVNQMPYLDDQGQQVTLADGSPLSIAQAQGQGLTNKIIKECKNLDIMISNGEVDKALKEVENYIKENSKDYQVSTYSALLDVYKQNLENAKKQYDLLDAQIKKTKAEASNIVQNTTNLKELLPWQKKQIKAQIKLMHDQGKLMVHQGQFFDAQRVNLGYQNTYLHAQTETENELRSFRVEQIDLSNRQTAATLAEYMPEVANYMAQMGYITSKQAQKIFIASQRARDRRLSNQDLKDINYTINNIPFMQYVVQAALSAGSKIPLK